MDLECNESQISKNNVKNIKKKILERRKKINSYKDGMQDIQVSQILYTESDFNSETEEYQELLNENSLKDKNNFYNEDLESDELQQKVFQSNQVQKQNSKLYSYLEFKRNYRVTKQKLTLLNQDQYNFIKDRSFQFTAFKHLEYPDIIENVIQLMECKKINDYIINNYISLLGQISFNVVFYDTWSLMNINFLEQDKFNKVLEKKYFNFEKDSLIFPIHEENHFYFLRICGIYNCIWVYDSRNQNLKKSKFNNIQKLFETKFQRFFEVKKAQFPQQNNDYDCGVYTLMGLRCQALHTVSDFRCEQIYYFRFHIIQELIYGKILLNINKIEY